MTLTELKYIVAVARERHFGRAAEACFVSQPTLSVAIKKLEDELGVQLFERGSTEVSITPIGGQIVEQAQRVLEESSAIKEIAKQGRDPLSGPLRLGVIHTIGPYLLPALVPRMIKNSPKMPLLLQEGLTIKLLESLRLGDIDVAILADPFPNQGFVTQAVYDEPFVVAVPNQHPWARRKHVRSMELKEETMLLLGTGHCFRDQVLEVCPELSRYSQASAGIQKTFEGSSLETIRHMVASGIGITVLPWTAMPPGVREGTLNGSTGTGASSASSSASSSAANPPTSAANPSVSATASASAAAGGGSAAETDVHDGGRGQGHASAQTSAHAGESHSDGLLTYVPFHPVAP
ncbi:MAG TPA: LysR substrate-binding domain-containing protein, partial [Lautropia sp.]|nr:LysR substrate-binding domain-containing protein [Lautropia sp.]